MGGATVPRLSARLRARRARVVCFPLGQRAVLRCLFPLVHRRKRRPWHAASRRGERVVLCLAASLAHLHSGRRLSVRFFIGSFGSLFSGFLLTSSFLSSSLVASFRFFSSVFQQLMAHAHSSMLHPGLRVFYFPFSPSDQLRLDVGHPGGHHQLFGRVRGCLPGLASFGARLRRTLAGGRIEQQVPGNLKWWIHWIVSVCLFLLDWSIAGWREEWNNKFQVEFLICEFLLALLCVGPSSSRCLFFFCLTMVKWSFFSRFFLLLCVCLLFFDFLVESTLYKGPCSSE